MTEVEQQTELLRGGTQPRFTTHVRVRYAETDAAGVVYYGEYPTYLEVARVELLRALGLPIAELESRGVLLPVVEVRPKYLRPARLDDLLAISIGVESVGPASFVCDYEITRDVQVVRVDAPPAARPGQTVTVRVMLESTAPVRGTLTLLREAKWSMGTLVAAALFGPYYWLVLQEDWRAGAPVPERPAAAKSVTLLIAEDGRAIVGRLEEALGVKVRVLQRADPDIGLPALTDEDVARLNRRIAEAPGGRVLLVADASGVEVYSYR